MCKKLNDYLDLPDDLFTLFLIDCAFGQETDMNFIKLDQIPHGRLRQGVEERILNHYKFYMRKMGNCNNIMQHSSHLIPSLEWSNESFENARFDSPSPSPMALRTTDLISNFNELNDKFFNESTDEDKTITIEDSTIEERTIDTITIDDSSIAGSKFMLDSIRCDCFDNTIPFISDCSCDKENIPPLEESISCGQPLNNSTPHNDDKCEYMDGIENAPMVKRKMVTKEPLARRLFF